MASGRTAKRNYKDLLLPTVSGLVGLQRLKRDDLPHPSKLRKNCRSKRKIPKATNSTVDVSTHLVQLKRKQSGITGPGASSSVRINRPSSGSSDSAPSRNGRAQQAAEMENVTYTCSKFNPTKVYDVKVTRERNMLWDANEFINVPASNLLQETNPLHQYQSGGRFETADAHTQEIYRDHIFDQASFWHGKSSQPDTPLVGYEVPTEKGFSSPQPHIEGAWNMYNPADHKLANQDLEQVTFYREPDQSAPHLYKQSFLSVASQDMPFHEQEFEENS